MDMVHHRATSAVICHGSLDSLPSKSLTHWKSIILRTKLLLYFAESHLKSAHG
jgi:hypothetical protein